MANDWQARRARGLIYATCFLGMVAAGSLCLQAVASHESASAAPARTVAIYRDDWGVPHIYADREEDGYYGLGYAQAEDRLETLLLRYLWARGEVAAALTPDELKVLPWPGFPLGQREPHTNDLEHHRWRHLEEARAGFARLSPQVQRNYRAFIAGIQRYLEEHPERIPRWAPPLEPALPIAYLRAFLWPWALGGPGILDCVHGGVKVEGAPPLITDLRQRELTEASNAWVLMPWRTAAGALIHLTDSHGVFEGSGEMYEFRLEAGPLKLAGTNLTGAPWLLMGHTPYLAWGMTNGFTDVADCYEVEVDPANPRRYRYDGAWKTMTTRDVSVAVKGGQPATRTFEYTDHNGVLSLVVAREGNKAYVVSSPYMNRAGQLDEQMYRQQLARTLDELIEAQRQVDMFPINFMVGEVHGNALYVRTGRVPIRPAGYDWRRPVPGNSSATAWQGIHPFEDLVSLRNPVAGYIQNNNVAPDRMVEPSPIQAERYPPYLFNDEPGFTHGRGRRAVELLSKTFQATVDDALAIALDEKWYGTESWLEALRGALNRHPEWSRDKPAELRRCLHRLLAFDGFARAESVAALNYLYWRTEMGGEGGLPEAELNALADAVEQQGPLTAAQEQPLLAAVERALTAQRARHGSAELRYGDVFRAGRGGYSWPLGGGSFRVGNRIVQPLRNMFFSPPDARGQRWVVGGQRQPMLTIFTNPIQSFSALPFGQSGRPDSPHYSDQARLLSERRLKPTYFYREELLKHVVSTTTLEVRE